MEFERLVKERQATRKFNGKVVEDEKILKIIELSRLAPSACNSQPWQLFVAKTPEVVKKVGESLMKGGRNGFVKDATCFIAIAEKERPLKPDVSAVLTDGFFVKYDIGEMIAYITLTAKNLGVDSCIIGWLNKEQLYSALEIPSDYECNIVIALGYSDIEIREKSRRPLEDIYTVK